MKMILYLIRWYSRENSLATHWTIDLVLAGGVYTSSRPSLDVIAIYLWSPATGRTLSTHNEKPKERGRRIRSKKIKQEIVLSISRTLIHIKPVCGQ
jgi:hypothetical protein